MSAATLAGLCAATLVGLGLYGRITRPQPLRKILAFNLLGSGVFLLFGIVARKGAAAGLVADPVPQALVITGIVVAFSATALALALRRWGDRLPRVPAGDIVVAAETVVRASFTFGVALERADSLLRQWPAAGLSLLVLVIVLGAAMLSAL